MKDTTENLLSSKKTTQSKRKTYYKKPTNQKTGRKFVAAKKPQT